MQGFAISTVLERLSTGSLAQIFNALLNFFCPTIFIHIKEMMNHCEENVYEKFSENWTY